MKIKNIIIYFCVFIIIFISFSMPSFGLKLVGEKIENTVFKKEKIEKKIDIEANRIYLAEAIHNIESENSSIAISSSNKSWTLSDDVTEYYSESNDKTSNNLFKIAKEELRKLTEYNILKEYKLKGTEKCNLTLITKIYKSSSEKNTINNIFLNTKSELYNIDIEEKTGKILFINFAKEELKDISKEEILRNYVKYLDLYIIDDWKYEENKLKSEKAGLVVSITEKKTRYMLEIHSSEKSSNNSIYNYNNLDTN